MALSNAERQKLYRERKKLNPNPPPPKLAPEAPSIGRKDWAGGEDLIDFLGSLPRVQAGIDGYEERDRAADFIATFSTEQGRRVLSQIASICDPSIHPNDADLAGTLAMKAGMRLVMNRIQRCFVIRSVTNPIEGDGND